MPADGSDVPTPEELQRPGVLATSTQHLANPPASQPEAAEVVHARLRRAGRGGPHRLRAARARAARQRLPALRAPTAAPRPVPGGNTDVLDVLTRQHDEVTSLVKQLDTIPGRSKGGTAAQASERESIVDMIAQALAAHETSEQQYLWPWVRQVLPDG